MNISDSGYNINISGVRPAGGQGTQNIQNQEATQQVAKGTSAGEVSANALISTAKEGQSFNGQILDITNDQVKILLDNNQTLNARMSEAVNLNIGDSLSFLIKENNGSNVLIKPFNQDMNLMKDSAIFNVLEQNNLSPSEKNYQIAESLMNNSMPVDKGSMQKIMQQSYRYPDASIDTLVNLNKLGLPINETSISQYNDYISNSHQLTKDISNINSSILEFSTEVLNNMGADFDKGLAGDTIMHMLDFNDTLLQTLSDAEDMANITSNSEILSQGIDQTDSNSDVAANLETQSTTVENRMAAADINITEQSQNEQLGISDNLINKGIDVKASSENLGIDKDTLSGLYESLSKLGVDDETLKNIANESKTPLQLLNNINKAVGDSFKDNPESFNFNEIKQFFTSEEYNKVLSGGINKKFTLDTNEMKNPSEIDDLYKSMYEKTDKLMKAFSDSSGSAGKNLSENARGMQERIDFMQTLNNMYSYAQIPFRNDGNDANSELFVYMNKKKINEAKDNISALLHLDMKFHGPTDVHVSLHGNNVHTRFYVEDEQSAKIIDEHMTMLEKAIKETGHTLTNEVITREPALALPENMVVNEMFGNELEKSVKRYSFDVRM
ncbi:MAG: flagellar hook-length control protein FliK [Lachnospiraceae bacterium]|nr:flagellar hook-length control protein FliK [Lachnospiraceae bacterium]